MSFQPFAVQCLTCGSRLRVADPAIVGTIAACPKCNSMVQIDRPEGQVAVGHSDVDSQAITKEGISLEEASTIAPEETIAASGFAGSETVDTAETEPVGPADPLQWQSQQTQRSRQVALVVAVSLAGLLSAVAVFSWFVNEWRQRSVPDTAKVASSEPTRLDQSPNPTSQTADTHPPPDTGNTLPIVATKAANRSEEPPPTQKPETQDLATAESIPGDLMPQSPIASVPESETPESEAPASPEVPELEAPASPEGEIGNMQELPPGLAKFMPFLLHRGATKAPTLEAPPTMDEVKIEAAAEDNVDPLIAAKPKKLNLKADLGIELALDSDGYPLADLMLLISQITGVPIQVDWVSLDLAGTDINARIPTRKVWRSAREILQEAASELGAEIREQQSLLIFTLTDATFERTMAGIADLSDFADTRSSAEVVLTEFLRGDEDAQAKEFQIGQSREQQQLAALAIESLRRMRGIEPKVADKRMRHWAQSSENESIQWPLLSKGDAGPPMDTPITIAGLLRRSSRRNQATCVVNWHDANRQGVSPQRLVLPYVDVDAATTLDQTLTPFALQVRQVDSQHWWVGSEATYDRLPVVVWTAPLGKARDVFIQRITAIMAGASRDAFRLSIDEQSDRALLQLPRFIVRQLPKITPVIAAK